MGRKVLRARTVILTAVALLGAAAASGEVSVKQRLTVEPATQTVAAGGTATVSIHYQATDSTLPGVALRLHYDSSQLELDGSKLLVTKASMGHQDQPDNDRFDDGDPDTDRRYLAVWSDFSGRWPGGDELAPVSILELTFRVPEGSAGGQLTLTATGCGGCRVELEPGTVQVAKRSPQITEESPTPTPPEPTATPTTGPFDSEDPPAGGGVAPGQVAHAVPTLSEVGGVVLGALLASSAVVILMRRGG